ncbi:MAG: epoxyqueuosine reductase QueH, partial [candidate division KSB1 bacterium]|nr:epoxyqueuosine reductase QueH [candidate division KSB1 bacterium]
RYGVHFLSENFKKKDGYKQSLELSAQFQLYRQDYCGCIFSQRSHQRIITMR